MRPLRVLALSALLVGLLVGCAAPHGDDTAGSPAGSSTGGDSGASTGRDAPVSDADGPSSTAGPVAGLGTVIITVRDPAGAPRALIPVEVRTVGWPMPAALAIDIARMTDNHGEYVWTDLPPGGYEFTVRVPGGTQQASRRVTVVADRTTPVTLAPG